jgi:hypothetical protein
MSAEKTPVYAVLVIDQSGSMAERGKWDAVVKGLATIAEQNKGLPVRVKRVFFQVRRKVDREFIPIDDVARDIPGRPDGQTAFFDAGRHSLHYLLKELNEHPEALGQVFFMTDGLDNQSRPNSGWELAQMIGMARTHYNADRPLERSRLMVMLLAFGDGSEQDRKRHATLAKYLNIPEAWFRYYVGEAAQVTEASESIGASVFGASTGGMTEFI